MKNLGPFRLWDATLAAALLCTISVLTPAFAQDGPGSKPEMMAPMHTAKPKVPSTTLTVTLGDKTLTLTAADLAVIPHETVTVTNGHTKATESYSGVPVSAILAKLGLPFEKANEHTLLKTCLVAEGTDGYKVVFSVYETLPAIRGNSVLIADTVDSKPLGKDGAFKLVVPGDTRPQRWVQNLKLLSFKMVE